MDSSTPHIGCSISLISNAYVRYTGTLDKLDCGYSEIILSGVRCHGTEDRHQAEERILPGEEIYEFVSFRGEDIKDLQVTAACQTDLSPQKTISQDFNFAQARFDRPTHRPSQSADLGPDYSCGFYDNFTTQDPTPNQENRERNSDTFGQSVVKEHLNNQRFRRGTRGRFRSNRKQNW